MNAVTIQLLSVYLTPDFCSDLPSLTNGDITYNRGTTNNRPVNTMATQSCSNGYIFSRDSGNTRVCVLGDRWSGSALTCIGEHTVLLLEISSQHF